MMKLCPREALRAWMIDPTVPVREPHSVCYVASRHQTVLAVWQIYMSKCTLFRFTAIYWNKLDKMHG